MLTPRHSHTFCSNMRSLFLKFQFSWYRTYIRNKVCIPFLTMVSVHQASIDKDATAKAPPPRTSSKSNPAKPPKAPKRTSSKEPLSRSSSVSKQIVVATDPEQLPPQESPMETDHAPPTASSSIAPNHPQATGAESSPPNANSTDITTVPQSTTAATALAPSSPPQSPRHQHQIDPSLQTTPPIIIVLRRSGKIRFTLTFTSLPPPSLMVQRRRQP